MEIIRNRKVYNSLPKNLVVLMGDEVNSAAIYNSPVGAHETHLYSVKGTDFVVAHLYDKVLGDSVYTIYANLVSFEIYTFAARKRNRKELKLWGKNLKI